MRNLAPKVGVGFSERNLEPGVCSTVPIEREDFEDEKIKPFQGKSLGAWCKNKIMSDIRTKITL